MKREEALQYRANIDFASALMSDAQADEHYSIFIPWKSGVDYVVGDRRKYKDALYRCVQAHKSQDDWTPDVTPALWTPTSTEEWPEWIQPTGAQDAYKQGDKVKHNDTYWISDVDNNVWEPGVYGWSEQAIEEAPAYDEADAVATLAGAITAKAQKSKVLENDNVVALLNKYGISIETE